MTDEKKPQDLDQTRAQLLSSLMNEPTRYFVEVLDKSMLPDHLKSKKEIEFVVKPPVLATLTKMAQVALEIPEEHRRIDVDPTVAMAYTDQIARIFAIMAHGSSDKEVPEWYVPFLMKNCTPQDLLHLYQECAMKIRTDFFLPSFQIASVLNPMTMISKNVRETLSSTPTDSSED